MQPPFKLRNSKLCSVSSLTVIEYSRDKQRLLSACAYAQAGLSLCWSHIPYCWKSHVTDHYYKSTMSLLDADKKITVSICEALPGRSCSLIPLKLISLFSCSYKNQNFIFLCYPLPNIVFIPLFPSKFWPLFP